MLCARHTQPGRHPSGACVQGVVATGWTRRLRHACMIAHTARKAKCLAVVAAAAIHDDDAPDDEDSRVMVCAEVIRPPDRSRLVLAATLTPGTPGTL